MNTILVADDEPHIRRLIRVNLERIGYNVVEADDGNTAWQRLQHEAFDLLITDLVMPEMSGDALIQAMDREASMATMPIVIMLWAPEDKRLDEVASWLTTYHLKGVLKNIRKPLHPSELKRLVQQVLPNK